MIAAPVSLCMIVRDEERFLGTCLESVRPFVEEIVVLDTGSKDRTLKIASAYADRVEQDSSFLDEEGFIKDFSVAREASYSLGTKPWRMWIDADDVVKGAEAIPALVDHLEAARNATGEIHIAELRYLYTFMPDGSCNQDFYRERITPVDAGFKWVRAIHESIKSDTPHKRVTVPELPLVVHRGQDKPRHERNLRILERLAADPGNIDPMIPYYIGNTMALTHRMDNSDRWLEQCIAMPSTHRIKLTAHKHLVTNALIQRQVGLAIDRAQRFMTEHPLSISAHFCMAKALVVRAENEPENRLADLLDARNLITHGLTLKREDDDVFFNPWEVNSWAPAVLRLIDEKLSELNPRRKDG